MANQTIDVAIRDDLCAQAKCSFRLLLESRPHPVCYPGLLALPAERRGTLYDGCEMDWNH